MDEVQAARHGEVHEKLVGLEAAGGEDRAAVRRLEDRVAALEAAPAALQSVDAEAVRALQEQVRDLQDERVYQQRDYR